MNYFFLFCNYCCVDGGTLVRGSAVIKINLVQHYVGLFIHGIMITRSWMVAKKLFVSAGAKFSFQNGNVL